MKFSIAAATMASLISLVAGQTFSDCNPMKQTCPANVALGRSISIDFRNGEVDSFGKTGGTSFESDGVHFRVSSGGDAPQLMSRFYIMFGKVKVRMRAAPGAGIVSSLVLQSDTLDEIDYEWIGAIPEEVQSNYFGKGDTTTYTRGSFHPTKENQNNFVDYEIDWTASALTWSIDGQPVRTLTPETAETNQYPQTPMQLKFGAWSAGDPSNAQGTIEWARGPTDYSQGPFDMIVESLEVTDYSTGTAYQYNGNSGNMDSIVAIDGSIGGNQGSSSQPSAVAPIAPGTSGPAIPQGIGYGSEPDTRSGWPYVTSGVDSAPSPTFTISGVPSGWIVSGNGKIVPISDGVTAPISTSPLQASSPPLVSSPSSPSVVGVECELVTTINQQGFPEPTLRPVNFDSLPKTYDDQGFLIGPTCDAPAPTAAPAPKMGNGTSGGATGGVMVVPANKYEGGGSKNKNMVVMCLWVAMGMLGGLFVLA